MLAYRFYEIRFTFIYRLKRKLVLIYLQFILMASWWVLMLAHNCHLYLFQNDLVHGWGVDMKLGYCAQVRNIHFLDTLGGCKFSFPLCFLFPWWHLSLCTILIVMQLGFLVLGSDITNCVYVVHQCCRNPPFSHLKTLCSNFYALTSTVYVYDIGPLLFTTAFDKR